MKQAEQWGLHTDTLDFGWGVPFNMQQIEQQLKNVPISYVVFVHGETSTSTLNPLEQLVELTERFQVKLCADCISSFGALPFSMENLHYATAVSGKSLGTVAGLSFIFCKEVPSVSGAPMYLNLPYYIEKEIPFTLPHDFIQAVNDALSLYPKRYTILKQRMELVKHSMFKADLLGETYPMIATIQHNNMEEILQICELNGFLLHSASDYLTSRNLAQISTIQPNFEKDFKKVNTLFSYVKETM